MRVGVAADHGGFELKERVIKQLQQAGHDVVDYGNKTLEPADDYPDYIVPMARGVAEGEVERGIALCGSGVGAAITASKVPGARASLITDAFSAHQGVEDDDMNIICLGGRITGYALALDLIKIFLDAKYKAEERFQRRLDKITALEKCEI